MLKKVFPIILGAVVAVGLAASAQAATVKIKVKCDTSFDWPFVGVVEYPGEVLTELGECLAGGSFEDEHELLESTEEVLVFAGTDDELFCWTDQANEFSQQFNTKGKCVEDDEKIKIKFKSID